jgi:hypothetical protein
MKIEAFGIQGYKNITRHVRLDSLDDRDFVVVHGLNNVGK